MTADVSSPPQQLGGDAQRWGLGDLLTDVVKATPDATALIIGPDRDHLTYKALADLASWLSATLLRHGLHPGDVVAVQAANTVEFVVALLGAAQAGLVVAPLDPALPAAQKAQRLRALGARITLLDHQPLTTTTASDRPDWWLTATPVTSSYAKANSRLQFRTPVPAADPPSGMTGDDALLMSTSGTGGAPKMVPWTHHTIACALAAITNTYQLTRSDATVAVMPLFHGHGLVAGLLATLATGGHVLLPARGNFTAHTFWDDLAAAGATWYTAVPTIHTILLNRASPGGPDHLRTRGHWLRFIRSCSAPLSAATARDIERCFGAPIVAAYGMTEATHQASTGRPTDTAATRLHTVGEPSGTDVRIYGPNNQRCHLGVIGEVWLRGPGVARGYLGDPAATDSAFVDGWLRTGDLGALDTHGTLTITGRIKDLINRGGEKISPTHVEEVLTSDPGIAEAAVLGIHDPVYGESVAAVIVPTPGALLTAEEVRTHCRTQLAPHEIPEHVSFAAALPMTAKGAIDRSALRAQYTPTTEGSTT